jgi:hypothetical protein
MTPEERAYVEEPCRQCRFEEWMQRSYWTSHEATCISLGWEPSEVDWGSRRGLWRWHKLWESARRYKQRRDTIDVALHAGDLGEPMFPPASRSELQGRVDLVAGTSTPTQMMFRSGIFAAWARDTGIDLHEEYESLAGRGGMPISTAAAELECCNWLTDLMKAGPKAHTKKHYRNEAMSRFAGRLSDRGFVRAWASAQTAVPDADWSKSGPSKK